MSDQKDTDRFHVRKNPRLKHYDYSTPNYYFVTVCTHGKRCIFGSPNKLNRYGQLAEQGILEIKDHFPNVRIENHVVMPNHIHAIIALQDDCASLSTILGQYKSHVSKQIHFFEPELKVWQASYHDHVIRNQTSYEKIWLYIEANPMNWEKDCFYELSATDLDI